MVEVKVPTRTPRRRRSISRIEAYLAYGSKTGTNLADLELAHSYAGGGAEASSERSTKADDAVDGSSFR